MPDIDPEFLGLPRDRLADIALATAAGLGVTHADFRLERLHGQSVRVRDGLLQGVADSTEVGMAVRVVHRGAWGFAAGTVLTEPEAARLARTAVQVAELAATMTRPPVALAPEPVHRARWVSAYEVDPFDVALPDRVDLLRSWSARLSAGAGVQVSRSTVEQVLENKHYADLGGTVTTQQRVRVHPVLEVFGSDARRGVADSMRSLAAPVARGWEYLSGDGHDDAGHDWEAEVTTLPELLAEKLAAPSVEPGAHDLLIDPTNLWLTIHESVGHATELDRALGYEANYAGTSFATPDRLGTLGYGSRVMHVTGDRTVPHGLATTGYDDEGVATQAWDIVRDGVLVGHQLDREMAQRFPDLNGGRSNGCSFADSPGHVPIQRMANVSLQPATDGPSTEELIAAVEDGLYVVGDKSWSIDMQRHNFQFTGQRFHRIRAGRLVGQVRDVAYQATTTDFWGSLEAVGGPQTWQLGGAFNCGKAQPGQIAAVSHGCPASLFRGVNVLNTAAETER
jgi:TldD protein